MTPNAPVSEILKQKGGDVWSIQPDATVLDAIKLMAEKNVGALVVTQKNKVVGIISERDYSRKVILKGKASKTTPVSDILSKKVVKVEPSTSVNDCLKLMTEKRIRHLPVLEGTKLKGIVSIGDLVNWVISAQSSTIEQLQTYITGYPS